MTTALDADVTVLDAMTREPLTSPQTAQVVDLSQSGCRVAMPNQTIQDFRLELCRDFPRDFIVELRLSPRGRGVWKVGGNLKWIIKKDGISDYKYQMGVKFEEPVALPDGFKRLFSIPPAGHQLTGESIKAGVF